MASPNFSTGSSDQQENLDQQLRPVRVALGARPSLLRDGLSALLAQVEGLHQVGVAGDAQALFRVVATGRPDVLILASDLPRCDEFIVWRRDGRYAHLQMILLIDEHEVRATALAVSLGGPPVLSRNCSFEELLAAIQRAVSTQARFRRLRGPARGANNAAGNCALDLPMLSAREKEVLRLVSEGLSTKAVAARLCVSGKTVDTHRQHIMSKLGIHNIAMLTKIAVRAGLTSLEIAFNKSGENQEKP